MLERLRNKVSPSKDKKPDESKLSIELSAELLEKEIDLTNNWIKSLTKDIATKVLNDKSCSIYEQLCASITDIVTENERSYINPKECKTLADLDNKITAVQDSCMESVNKEKDSKIKQNKKTFVDSLLGLYHIALRRVWMLQHAKKTLKSIQDFQASIKGKIPSIEDMNKLGQESKAIAQKYQSDFEKECKTAILKYEGSLKKKVDDKKKDIIKVSHSVLEFNSEVKKINEQVDQLSREGRTLDAWRMQCAEVENTNRTWIFSGAEVVQYNKIEGLVNELKGIEISRFNTKRENWGRQKGELSQDAIEATLRKIKIQEGDTKLENRFDTVDAKIEDNMSLLKGIKNRLETSADFGEAAISEKLTVGARGDLASQKVSSDVLKSIVPKAEFLVQESALVDLLRQPKTSVSNDIENALSELGQCKTMCTDKKEALVGLSVSETTKEGQDECLQAALQEISGYIASSPIPPVKQFDPRVNDEGIQKLLQSFAALQAELLFDKNFISTKKQANDEENDDVSTTRASATSSNSKSDDGESKVTPTPRPPSPSRSALPLPPVVPTKKSWTISSVLGAVAGCFGAFFKALLKCLTCGILPKKAKVAPAPSSKKAVSGGGFTTAGLARQGIAVIIDNGPPTQTMHADDVVTGTVGPQPVVLRKPVANSDASPPPCFRCFGP